MNLKKISIITLCLIIVISLFMPMVVYAEGAGISLNIWKTPNDEYTNITIINGNYTNLIIFSKPEDTITGDGNGNFTTANTETGESSDYYYITSSQNNNWSACNDLSNKEKVDNATLTTQTGGYYYTVLVGQIEGNIRNGTNGKNTKGKTISEYIDINYKLDYDKNTKYHKPAFISEENIEYVIFKRSADEKYIIMFYDKSAIGGYEYAEYFKIGRDRENTLRVNKNTQFVQFNTIQECYSYLFTTPTYPQVIEKYPIDKMPNSSGFSSSTDRLINGFDGTEEIVMTTMEFKNSDDTVKTEENTKDYREWYYETYGEYPPEEGTDTPTEDETEEDGIIGLLKTILEYLNPFNWIKASNGTIFFDKAGELINESLKDNKFYTSILSVRDTLTVLFNEDYSDPNGFYKLGLVTLTMHETTEKVYIDHGNETIGPWEQEYELQTGNIDWGLDNAKIINLDWYFGKDLGGGYYTKGLKPTIDAFISAFLWLMFAWYLYVNMPNWLSGDLTKIESLATNSLRSDVTTYNTRTVNNITGEVTDKTTTRKKGK